MVTFQPIFYFVLAITISIFPPAKSLDSEAKNVGFSVDLIHRDSLKSPFYNHSLIHSQRFAGAIRRSFHHRQMSASTVVIPNSGEYLMKISIGTPPVEMVAIPDTGSDLMWIQCQPCKGCLKQDSPLFNPQKSSTFKKLSCTSKECRSIPDNTVCDAYNHSCMYHVAYGDKTYSYGDLATETIALSSLSFSKMIFGCAHKDGGSFDSKNTGIIGIGGGPNSLISQLGPKFGGKFSYCLVEIDSNTSSKLSFGENKGFSHFEVVSTPLVRKIPSTFYFVTLEKITVGHTKIQVFNKSSSDTFMAEEGNIIVDSGTTLTYLPSDIYDQVESEVKKYVNAITVKDPQGILDLCYMYTKLLRFPRITMHFKDAKLKLRTWNTFIGTGNDTVCLAFAPATDFSILGNVAQVHVFVGYDLTKKTVSFRPTNCEKLRY